MAALPPINGSPHTQDEVVELAAEEGHDADIPSSVGVITHDGDGSKAKEIRTEEKGDLDIEKEAGSIQESLSSIEPDGSVEPQQLPEDPNIVTWDGPNDPENPMNWPATKKWGSVAVVSGITLLTPLGSSMIAPGVPGIMKEFHSTNELLEGFVVSVYVLGFAFGPLIIAPLSEMYGRLPLYHSAMVLFTIFNIICAVSQNMGMLIVFRFLAGSVGASPLALGGGTIADLIPRDQRGTAMAMWVMGPTLGPVVGPVAGGFISEYIGWRWCFWILSISAGLSTVLAMLLMKETYAVTILQRKTNRLKKETGNPNLRSKLDTCLSPKDLFLYSIVRPTKMLFFSPIVFLLSLYIAIAYAYLYILFTTFTSVFESQYGFSKSLVGLTFLGLGVGQMAGQAVYTIFGNRSVRKHSERGDFKPEHRLPIMCPGAITIPISLFWYAWTVEYHVHWIVPIMATGLFGFGMLVTFMPANTYLVDAFTAHAASAMAANTVLRSIFAAVLPLAGPTMYAKLGLGWGNSLLAFIAVAMVPVPFVFLRYGEYIRTRYPVKL